MKEVQINAIRIQNVMEKELALEVVGVKELVSVMTLSSMPNAKQKLLKQPLLLLKSPQISFLQHLTVHLKVKMMFHMMLKSELR